MNNKKNPRNFVQKWMNEKKHSTLSQRSRFNGVVCRFDLSTFGSSVLHRRSDGGESKEIGLPPWVEKKTQMTGIYDFGFQL